MRSLIALALVAWFGVGGRPLKTVAREPLLGPANRFDYASIDLHTHCLYIAHMAASSRSSTSVGVAS